MNLIDERFNFLSSEIATQAKQRVNAVEQLEADLETDFPKL